MSKKQTKKAPSAHAEIPTSDTLRTASEVLNNTPAKKKKAKKQYL